MSSDAQEAVERVEAALHRIEEPMTSTAVIVGDDRVQVRDLRTLLTLARQASLPESEEAVEVVARAMARIELAMGDTERVIQERVDDQWKLYADFARAAIDAFTNRDAK